MMGNTGATDGSMKGAGSKGLKSITEGLRHMRHKGVTNVCFCCTRGKKGKDPAVDVITGVHRTLHNIGIIKDRNGLKNDLKLTPRNNSFSSETALSLATRSHIKRNQMQHPKSSFTALKNN